MMKSYLNKVVFSTVIAAFSFLAVPVIIPQSNVSFVSTVHAEEGHDSGHSGSSHKGKGPKYKGGRGAEGHGGSDSAHKGGTSHGGGSKTLEDTVFKSPGGKQYKGGGKGGHEDEGGHEESEGGDTHDHTEPQ